MSEYDPNVSACVAGSLCAAVSMALNPAKGRCHAHKRCRRRPYAISRSDFFVGLTLVENVADWEVLPLPSTLSVARSASGP